MQNLILNMCNHDRDNPKFFGAMPGRKKRPFVLLDAIVRLRGYYFAPHKRLKCIADLQDRQKRSERRESIASTLQFLMYYTDLTTLQVGTPLKDGSINHLRIENFIAKHLKMGAKRTWRALHDVEKAGYITIVTKKVFKFDKIYSICKIHMMRKAFFDLGIAPPRLNESQHYKQKSMIKKEYRAAKPTGLADMISKHERRGPTSMSNLFNPAPPEAAPEPITEARQEGIRHQEARKRMTAQEIERSRQKHAAIHHEIEENKLTGPEAMVKLGYKSLK